MSFLSVLSDICTRSAHASDSQATTSDLLDSMELSWRHGAAPDLRRLTKALPVADCPDSLIRLLAADVRWRWNSGCSPLKWSLRDYEQQLSLSLTHQHRTRLLCHEFAIRNTCGDAISRQALCLQYPELEQSFLKCVDTEIRGLVPWPVLQVTCNGSPVSSGVLDRPLAAGRQQNSEQTPWSFLTKDFEKQLILSEMPDRTVSRSQLQLSLDSPQIIKVKNNSSTRPIEVQGQAPLACGETRNMRLIRNIRMHITGQYWLHIERGHCNSPVF